MAASGAVVEGTHNEGAKRAFAWEPPLPLSRNPVFVWPPRILETVRYLFSGVYFWSLIVPFGLWALSPGTSSSPRWSSARSSRRDGSR